MDHNDIMFGCLFPSGLQLYGLKNAQETHGSFYIECRNVQKTKYDIYQQ